MLARLELLFRTVFYLRWEQLVYRPWRCVQFRSYRTFPFLTKRWLKLIPPVTEAPIATISQFRRAFQNNFLHWLDMPENTARRIAALTRGEFCFLNQTQLLTDIDWNARYVSHLWNYQFHYQDYVVWLVRAWAENKDASAWHKAKQLIESWLASAQIGISDGWDAYPLSLRIVNWIYAYALIAENEEDQPFLARWRTSIFQQLDFLSHHPEKHLLANHLFKNIKALVIGGLFFSHTDEGRRWLSAGKEALTEELKEQILPDGGHYERTPMYHAQTLADLLECYVLLNACGQVDFASHLRDTINSMAKYLASLSYADGELALFNDSVNTFETRPLALLEAAFQATDERAKVQCVTGNFPESGYYVWQSPDEREKIIVDAGEPSVAYNTAHAHCDMLSYELMMNGELLIVDSGVHGYGGSEFREYCRSTRAHNTVMLENIEQSEVWGTFRMARRAKVLFAQAANENHEWRFEGEIQGYSPEGLRHLRSIQRFGDGEWQVTDTLSLLLATKEGRAASSFVHLHPAVKVSQQGGSFLCETQSSQVLIEPFGEVTLELITGVPPPHAQGWYFPEFGVALPSATIVMRCLLADGDSAKVIGYRIKPIPKP